MRYEMNECKLYNEKKNGGLVINGNFIYSWENSFSREDKIAFIDEYYEVCGKKGVCSYMINVINKYLAEKDNFPKDSWGYVKTVSLKAWLRKNDSWGMISRDYHLGSYRFAGREYANFATFEARPTWSSSCPYYAEEGKLVDLWFHDVLNNLCNAEEKYAKDNDPVIIKLRKIAEFGRIYGGLGIKVFDFVANNGEKVLDEKWLKSFGHEKPSEEEIDVILKSYEEIDSVMKAKVAEIQNKLGWERM